MRRQRWNSFIAFAVALIACIGIWIGGPSTEAGGSYAATDNARFVMMAVDEDGWIIRPEYVAYTEGQTIREALKATEHQFPGIDNDWIQEIDGHSFNISRFYDGGEYDLSAPAQTIQKAIVFTWRSEGAYSDDEAYLDLAVKLAGYPEKDRIEQTFKPVRKAYDNAFRDLPSANSGRASTLLADIRAAEGAYAEWMEEAPCTVNFKISQNGSPVFGAAYLLKDETNNLYQVDSLGTAHLRSGEYTFIAEKGMNQVEGSFSVEKNTASIDIPAELPGADWFGEIGISTASGSNWAPLPIETSSDGNTISVSVPDDVTGFYPKVAPGEAINNIADMSSHRFYADVVQTDGNYFGDESKSTNARSWNSTSSSVPRILAYGLTGREDVRFKVVHKEENGITQRQYKNISIIRVPTLKDLTVMEPSGTVLALKGEGTETFSKAVKSYEVTTIADDLQVGGKTKTNGASYGAFSEGYSIEVNGVSQSEGGTVSVQVSDGDVIGVSAKAENGKTDDYSITVHKVAGAHVTLNKEKDSVHVHLLNSTGSVILPDSETATKAEFTVAPGSYTWVGSIEEQYHTSSSIEVPAAGFNGTVTTPRKEELLKDLYVKTGTQKTAPVYEEADGKSFVWTDHKHTYLVWDNCTGFQIYYEVSDIVRTKSGKVIRGSYSWMKDRSRTQSESSKDITSSVTGNIASANFVCSGTQNNALVFRVEYTDQGVKHYQEYSIDMKRKPIAQDIGLKSVASGKERAAGIRQIPPDEAEGFDSIIEQYMTSVPRGSESLIITVDFSAITVSGDGEFVIRSGDSQRPRSAEAGKAELTVPLDPALDQETVEVVLDTGEAQNVTNVYSIRVNKSEPIRVGFEITPNDHNLVVRDNSTHELLNQQADGTYELMEGGTYTYTVTAHGYNGYQVTDYTAAGPETIHIDLEQSLENESLNTDLEADWPRFRFDDSNNGATNYLTPVEAEKTTLYWANQIGSGYGSGATGCPIIVGDYLYTYAGTSILKVDRYTGEVVKTGDMTVNSSFAINSPCYAEGMIFVGLSGGRVQAFNAETLESLWIYQDPLGGQPNCPIAYHDGYIYTGFWNSETKPADFVCISVTDEDPSSPDEQKIATWTVEDNGFYWAGAYVGPGAFSKDNTYIIVGTDDGDSGYTAKSGNLLSIDRRTGSTIDRFDAVCTGDIRSSICYDNGKFYFTSKGGYFCSIEINEDGTFKRSSLKKLYLSEGNHYNETTPPMSTSTPCVYNGRAYVGVSGTGQFSDYSGHNITVIDLDSFRIAYSVATRGYPQTSGLLTKAYDDGDGSCYVYFIDNASPGAIRVIRDAPGQTEPVNLGQETVTVAGEEVTYDVAYTLWTPFGNQAQYAICSPISDEYGNIYFKNDSAYMMMIGATIDKMEVTTPPDKTTYEVGEVFDPAGMVVKAHYSNGKIRDVTKYITCREEPFTEEEIGSQPVDLIYYLGDQMMTYQDRDGKAGQDYEPPTGVVTVTVRAHEHEYGPPVFSWTEDGTGCTAVARCRCGETIEKTGTVSCHTVREPGCEEPGVDEYTAVFDDSAFPQQTRNVLTPPQHDWDEGKEVQAEGCGTAVKLYTCRRDPNHIRMESISQEGHTWDGETVDRAPTCTITGEKSRHCTVCDAIDPDSVEVIPAAGHQMGEPAYQWSEDHRTCTATVACTAENCDDVEGSTVTETAEASENVKEATCSATGERICTAVFLNERFTTQVFREEISKTEHTPDWAVREKETAPSCETAGSYDEVTYCAVCNNELNRKTVQVPALGHDWDEGSVTRKPTESREGVMTYKCRRDPSHIKTEAIPMLSPSAEYQDLDKITPSDAMIDQKAKVDKNLNITAGSIATTASIGKKTMTVSWKKVGGAVNYRIAYKEAKAKKWSVLWSKGKNSIVLKKLKKNGLYDFKLQAVKKSGGVWIKSSWSKVNYRYFAGTTQKVKAGKKSFTATVKKVKGAAGYETVYSLKKTMKPQKVKAFKGAGKTKLAVKGLKAKKTYYVQTRPYKQYGGHKYLGVLNKAKAIKVK